jgi:hypothetical protein
VTRFASTTLAALLSAIASGGAPIAAPLPAAVPAAPIAVVLTPFEATYSLERDGMHIADARFVLARDGEDGWTFMSETKPAGFIALLRSDVIIELSAFRMGAERPIPLHYRYEHHGSNKDRDARYAYDWQKERVTGTFRGKPVDLPLARGTLDPLTLRLTVGLDLARGALLSNYSVVERRTTREYRLTALPPQRIRVPFGELAVVGVSRQSEDGTKTTRFLYAPAEDWAPVLMEQSETDEATYRLELVSFRRL